MGENGKLSTLYTLFLLLTLLLLLFLSVTVSMTTGNWNFSGSDCKNMNKNSSIFNSEVYGVKLFNPQE